MADYSDSKPVIGDVFPVGGVASSWTRFEPLITPEKLKRKHLWGIPLESGMIDRFGQRDVMTNDDIAEFIDSAVGVAELESGLTIFPLQLKEKQPWDRQAYDSCGYFQLPKRPIASIERLTVNLSNNADIYEVPLDWIEVGQLQWGQLNIIPLTVSLTSGNLTAIPSSAGGALLLSIFQGKSQWVASFWQVIYTAGFKEGQIPKVVNDYIGTIAAMDVLSQLASTYAKNQGASLNIDGAGQSVSSPGPKIFKDRLEELAQKRAMLCKKLKNLYHLALFSNNV